MRKIFEKGQRVRVVDGWYEGEVGFVSLCQLHGFIQGKIGAHKRKKETDIPHAADYWKYLVTVPGMTKKIWYQDYEIEDAPTPNSVRFIKDD